MTSRARVEGMSPSFEGRGGQRRQLHHYNHHNDTH